MKKLKVLLRVIGSIQIILGLFYLFAPATILEATGHSIPADDVFYPLAMLASRFLVLGGVFIYLALDPVRHRLWIAAMVAIQLLDLAAGIFYTSTGVVELSDSFFPMFNATWIAALLYVWRPRVEPTARS